MRVVVGLGNPGRRYEKTRHNVGFRAVEALAERCGASWTKSRYQAELAEASLASLGGPGLPLRGPLGPGEKLLLVKPTTYMNESGRAVGGICTYFEVGLDQLLVICDDLDLALARIRLKRSGGSGGQNGLKSIARHLNSQDWARLKIGIGRDQQMLASDYVLQRFSEDQREPIAAAIERAADAATSWAIDGVDAAMNQHNISQSHVASEPPASLQADGGAETPEAG